MIVSFFLLKRISRGGKRKKEQGGELFRRLTWVLHSSGRPNISHQMSAPGRIPNTRNLHSFLRERIEIQKCILTIFINYFKQFPLIDLGLRNF